MRAFPDLAGRCREVTKVQFYPLPKEGTDSFALRWWVCLYVHSEPLGMVCLGSASVLCKGNWPVRAWPDRYAAFHNILGTIEDVVFIMKFFDLGPILGVYGASDFGHSSIILGQEVSHGEGLSHSVRLTPVSLT